MIALWLLGKKTKVRGAVGLALGAGSARGLAHIGVLKVLEEEKIPIEVIVGTSAGALVGGLCAAGKSAKELADLILSADLRLWGRVFLPTFPRGGFIDGKRVSDFLATLIHDTLIENLPIKFAAVATDFISGEEVVIRQGPLREAIRASTSLPGIFSPPWHEGRLLCDGGLVNPVPVDVCRQLGADVIIAVNVNPRLSIAAQEVAVQSIYPMVETNKFEKFEEKITKLADHLKMDGEWAVKIKQWLHAREEGRTLKSPFTLLEAMTQAFSVVYARNLYHRSKSAKPDVILEPDTHRFSGMDFEKGEELINIGEACGLAKIDEIKKLINQI